LEFTESSNEKEILSKEFPDLVNEVLTLIKQFEVMLGDFEKSTIKPFSLHILHNSIIFLPEFSILKNDI
jgi:hypothetical protein